MTAAGARGRPLWARVEVLPSATATATATDPYEPHRFGTVSYFRRLSSWPSLPRTRFAWARHALATPMLLHRLGLPTTTLHTWRTGVAVKLELGTLHGARNGGRAPPSDAGACCGHVNSP